MQGRSWWVAGQRWVEVRDHMNFTPVLYCSTTQTCCVNPSWTGRSQLPRPPTKATMLRQTEGHYRRSHLGSVCSTGMLVAAPLVNCPRNHTGPPGTIADEVTSQGDNIVRCRSSCTNDLAAANTSRSSTHSLPRDQQPSSLVAL